jgi:hypothetical protein
MNEGENVLKSFIKANIIVLAIFLFPLILLAADETRCISCHDGKTTHRMTGRLQASTISPKAELEKSVHKNMSCTSCHLEVASAPHKRSMPVVKCCQCHGDVGRSYDKGLHGVLLKGGNKNAPSCSRCHGSHLILSHKNTSSQIYRNHIPEVCGQCHKQIYNEYSASIHGRALKAGRLEVPVCTDCHGEHAVSNIKDPNAAVYASNIARTCSGCHESQKVIGKYDLPSGRYTSYTSSFHGVAVEYGNLNAANCTSCHEVHRILPAAEAESSVSPQNLPKTCGKCHPGMKGAASIGKIHVEAKKESSPGMYYVRHFYMWFIGGLMVLFICYIALDIYGGVIRRSRHDR